MCSAEGCGRRDRPSSAAALLPARGAAGVTAAGAGAGAAATAVAWLAACAATLLTEGFLKYERGSQEQRG